MWCSWEEQTHKIWFETFSRNVGREREKEHFLCTIRLYWIIFVYFLFNQIRFIHWNHNVCSSWRYFPLKQTQLRHRLQLRKYWRYTYKEFFTLWKEKTDYNGKKFKKKTITMERRWNNLFTFFCTHNHNLFSFSILFDKFVVLLSSSTGYPIYDSLVAHKLLTSLYNQDGLFLICHISIRTHPIPYLYSS